MQDKVVSEPQSAQWFFFNGGPGAPRYGDDPTKHAVDHDTETFVREVLQNANDQRLDDSEPVEVTFKFVTLENEEKTEFLRAIGWNNNLGEHIEAVADTERGRGYEDFVTRLNEDEPLRLLVVEDRNTTGLTGSWEEDSNYAALVRDELYSSKQSETAGGSYGLGKSVLWTFSGASTVVFNSVLSGGETRDERYQRLIARTKLPTHRTNDEKHGYQGAGWLCRPVETEDGPRPESLWDEEAESYAEDLHVSREQVPGTSILVVDYRDPTRDVRPDLEALADEFVESAVKYFWPAIYRGDLDVRVEVEGETRDADIRSVPAIRPFLECFESRYKYDSSLERPGDVAGLDIPVSLPPRADGTETPEAEVRLAARLASPADDDSLLNRVALFRGSGMVVKYLDQSRVAFGDRNFHAVLACGEINDFRSSVGDGDREIERFLRYAEPPEHDDWRSTENLREEYQRGYRTALEEMFDTTRDGLRHLITQSDGRGETLAQAVRSRFPIHGGQARTRSGHSPTNVFEIESSSTFEDDRWTFKGRVVALEDEFEGWTAEVSMAGIGEDGSRYDDVPIARIKTEHSDVTTVCEDGVGRISAGDAANDVTFYGESEKLGSDDVRSGQIGETQLEIRAELEVEGE